MAHLASTASSTEHYPSHPAALRSRAQPGRKRLGIPARQQARQSSLRQLRDNRLRMLPSLERSRGDARNRRLNHATRMGKRVMTFVSWYNILDVQIACKKRSAELWNRRHVVQE